MKQKLTLMMAATLLLGATFAINPVAWSFEKQLPSRIPEDQIFGPFLQEGEKDPTFCKIQNDDGVASWFYSGFDSGSGLAVYMDPAKCAAQSNYPFKITDLHFYLYQGSPTGWSWPVNIQVNIRKVTQGDKCLGPDSINVVRSEFFTIPIESSYTYLGHPMNVSLNQPPCVNEPFFLEIKYLDHFGEGDTLPSLLMDTAVASADTCNNWGRRTDGTYDEWQDFWKPPLPGEPIIRATGYAGATDCETLWYWKADIPDQEFPAPSGMPDFDQNQFGTDSVSLCGPAAAANCLWWYNAVPSDTLPPDLIRLLSTYFKCNPHPGGGTYVDSMELGLDQYFIDHGFNLYAQQYLQPNFYEMEDSLKKSQDIILLLSFYQEIGPEEYQWVGGHFVTMAGVCSESLKIALSDPARDVAVEFQWSGRIRPPDHPGPPVDSTLHNDPTYVSQDIFIADLESPIPESPDWVLRDFYNLGGKGVAKFLGQNFQPEQEHLRGTYIPGQEVITEVEYAVMVCPKTSAVEEEEEGVSTPKNFELYQNYPNPFNNETVIRFDLRKPAEVTLVVYNILGQKVRTLVKGHFDAGPRSVSWDGRDEKENELASGIYFYQLKDGEVKETKRLALLK